MIRVLELFAGIGAASKALENLGVEHEIVDAVEIDKYAIKAFNAIHGTSFEPQDITMWDKDIECDLIIHGSPCQDYSIAGLQAGGDKGSGTRSSLMYESVRIIEKLRPKYVIWENVKNLLSKKHRHNFDAYLETMERFGYTNYYQVLDAKNYGVPQHRERVFTVSILGGGHFKFPEAIPLKRKLKDVLEKDVDERYYISSAMMDYFMGVNQKPSKFPRKERFLANINRANQDVGNSITTNAGQRPTDNFVKEPTPLQREVCDRAIEGGLVMPNDAIEYTYSNARLGEIEKGYIRKQNRTNNQIMSTLKTNPQQIGVCVRTANKVGYDVAIDGDGVDLAYPDSETRRGRVGHGVAKTIPTSSSQGVLDGVRIRKLTPRECYRLMGFDDESFDKASKVISNTQLYKTAGNSIVVDVLMAIFGKLLNG